MRLHARRCLVSRPSKYVFVCGMHALYPGRHLPSHPPLFINLQIECVSGMNPDCNGGEQAKDLPLGCWHNILRHASPPDLAQAASVNKTCYSVSNDQRLWLPHFVREWSPECCVSTFCPCLPGNRPSEVDIAFCTCTETFQVGDTKQKFYKETPTRMFLAVVFFSSLLSVIGAPLFSLSCKMLVSGAFLLKLLTQSLLSVGCFVDCF
jgi:hypothetical protein